MSSITITPVLPVSNTVNVTQTVSPVALTITEQVTQHTVVVSPQNITNYYGGGGEVLAALTGVPVQSTNLGTFTGDIIVDNETIKGALQDLEDGVENNESAISTNAGDITTNANDISSLTTTVNGNTSSINTNTSDITSLQTTVNGLTTGALTQDLDPTELNLFFTDPGTYTQGTSVETVLRDVLIHYQTPSITSFVANGIPTTTQEHGYTDTITTASWIVNNGSNINAAVLGSIEYYDPVGTDSQTYTNVAYNAYPYTLNKAITLNVTSGTAGATNTPLAQNNTYYLRLSGLQNTLGAGLSVATDFISVQYRTFVITSPTAIAAGSVNATTGNALLSDALSGTNGSTVEYNNLSSDSRRQTTLTYPDTTNYWYLCMPQCHYEYVNKITTNQGFVGFDITATVVDCGAFVYTNPEGVDVNMQLLRGPSIGQIQSGNYIKTEYDSGSALNTPAPPTAGQPPPATNLLLNDYTGAAAAYSVRLLDKDYSGRCMRIRRASDDAETDIGFDSNGDLDTAAIAAHCSTSSGFVTVWADQSGNGNDATQSTPANQPQIYDGSAVITVESGGKPALFSTDASDGFSAAAGAIDVTSRTIYQWSVYSLTGTGNYPTITPSALYEGHNVSTEIPRTGTNRATFAGLNAASAINTNQAYLRHSYADTTDFKTFLDGSGTAIISGTDTNADWATSGLQIFDTNFGATGQIKLSEFIMWQSDQSTNRTGIESDINSDYLIYQPTDAPTSGLLATYTGAAAAYSVRQLSDKAVIAMRIRRDSDDEERNIGFDSNGDLDTTAISDFCGTANGYVTRWWDQSTNGNHADQATPSAQPQIYNGTAVITSGSTTVRPSLQFETSASTPIANTGFNLSFASTLSQPFTASITTRDITTGTGEMAWMDNGNTIGLNGVAIFSSGTPDTLGIAASSALNSTAQKDSDMLLFGVFNTTNSELFKNNSSIVSGNAGTNSLNGLTIGGLRPGINERFGIHGNVQEWILWDTAQGSTNRNGIHSDTNTYFGIY